MSEVTKRQTTTGFVDLSVRVPASHAESIQRALENILALIEAPGKKEDELVSWNEAIPPAKPGELLQAARYREDLTQAKLAQMVGVTRSNISDMERGGRTITPDMAKRLAKVLNTSYKNFL